MITLHGVSHLDHNLTTTQLAYIKERFLRRDCFFKETFELPEGLGDIEVSLIGPAVDMMVITEDDVRYEVRPGRRWASRVIKQPEHVDSSARWVKERSRLITVIAGPYGNYDCVLYTAYGGPEAPREPGDPSINSWEELQLSRAFWAEHALIID